MSRVTVTLSADAAAVVAGLVGFDTEVNRDGIYTTDDVWAEVRAAYPLALFQAWAAAHPRDRMLDSGGQGYDPDAGT